MAIRVKPETALRGTRAIVQVRTLLRHNVLNPFLNAVLSSGSSRGPYPLRRMFDSSRRNHFMRTYSKTNTVTKLTNTQRQAGPTPASVRSSFHGGLFL